MIQQQAAKQAVKTVTVAHSPDSDDAFMFYALATNKIRTDKLIVKEIIKDIQSLNEDALAGTYEVSAISFAVYPQICNRYALMPCGASMGLNYGPLVIAKKPLSYSELKGEKIAIPGKLTTAYLALRIFEPEFDVTEMPFDQILTAVQQDKVRAGLIIHEGQLSYQQFGLYKIIDLGEWWFAKTKLPLPLGGNVIAKNLEPELIKHITVLLQSSIKYSLTHRTEALAYAMQYARNLPQDQVDQFVGMYVNDLSVDYGEEGKRALSLLFDLAYNKGLLSHKVTPEFVV